MASVTQAQWGTKSSHQPVPESDPAYGRLGKVLDGRFQITRLLGRGGMGVVYEGVDRVLERIVVIKIIGPRVAETGGVRLIREARMACRIQHPGVVTVFHLGLIDHVEPFIVMERLVGQDLSKVAYESGPLPLGTVVALLEPVGDALGVLHAEGVVHRDIKPENMFLLDGRIERPRVKLIDFGLAMLDAQSASRLTTVGMVLGTPEYLAPECARGLDATPASDVYSFATTVFELLTGSLPFPGTGMDALIAKTKMSPARLDEALHDPSLRPVADIVDRGLRRDPQHRPSIGELMTALRDHADEGRARIVRDRVTEPAPPPVLATVAPSHEPARESHPHEERSSAPPMPPSAPGGLQWATFAAAIATLGATVATALMR